MNKTPKNIFGLFFVFSLILIGSFVFTNKASAATYYVRADGNVTCANKINATSPSLAGTALNMTQVNVCTFSDEDQILFSSQGGVYSTRLIVPSGGSSTELEIIYKNVTSETPTITASVDNFIDTNSQSNIIIDGLKTDYRNQATPLNGVFVTAGSNITLQNLIVYQSGNAGVFSTGITINGTANNITVNDSTVTARGNAVIIDNDAHDITLNRVTATSINYNDFTSKGTSHNQTYNNCIAANGTNGFDASESAYNITYNDCISHTNSSNGFAPLNNTHDITYNRCIAYNNGIWTSASNGTGFIPHNAATNIYHNSCIAYNNKNSGFGDVSTGNIYFNNMVSWGNGYMIGDTFRGQAVTANSVRGNLYFNKTSGMAYIKNSIMGQSKPREIRDGNVNYTTYDYNIYYPLNNSKFFSTDNVTDLSWDTYHTTDESHSLNSNPLFTNSTLFDFSLLPTSPAINAGIDVSLISDYLGNLIVGAPDIGAYEFQAPTIPTTLSQYKADGATSITSGDFTNEDSVVLKFNMSSSDDNSSDLLTPQVEIQESDISFTNTVTNSGTAVAYSGTSVLGTVTVTGLTSGKSYHWQARVSNSAGQSSWFSMGGNPDFQVDTTAPLTPIATPSSGTYTSTQTVTLSATGSDSIRYAIDAIPTDCSSGTLYTVPISVSTSQTIYVRACDSLNNSSTASFVYIISPVRHTSSGSSVSSRFNNLISMGNLQAAEELRKEFPNQIPNQIIISPLSTPISIIKTLKLTAQRMKGEDVKILQNYLNTKGYDCGIVDGIFGTKTKKAVIQFQLASQLKGDGIVGPKTKEMMK